MSDGLEGRSKNPIALLYDKLKHPDADLGLDSPSCLTWDYDPLKEIDHVVIGKSPGPGGAWNDLDGTQLTISPSRWMELPDMSYNDWERQSNLLSSINAGLIFSSKTSNFSEDNSLLNANFIRKPSITTSSMNNNKNYLRQLSSEEARASMHDVRNYYRDYVKQKNLDKYLLNNATVTSVRGVCASKLVNADIKLAPGQILWEVTGLIDKRDRKKASSLTHKGDLMEFRYFCKHLVLACGATDLPNNLNVKGENNRFILRTIRELEDKIRDDLPRLLKDPLLIVGSGLSAADAILLAQKYRIKIVHVIRRSVNDPNLVFPKLPKQIYPEYHRVYDLMLNNKCDLKEAKLDNPDETVQHSYVLYDEHQVKMFTSKRTCVLVKNCVVSKENSQCSSLRHLQLQKQHHQLHQRQLNEFDEEMEASRSDDSMTEPVVNCKSHCVSNEVELKVSYACILIGFMPSLDFMPTHVLNELAVKSEKQLNTKDNPICVNEFTHESERFKCLYAMGPLVGDNFVRFGTGGALAITSKIVNYKKQEQQIKTPIRNQCFNPSEITVINN